MTQENIIVQKYGGSSVATTSNIEHVARHIADTARQGHRVVAVVSAMGDQTDELIKLAHDISPQPPRRELDMLLSAGERITMALLSIALDKLGLPAQSLTGSQTGILTDDTHTNARISKISGERLRAALFAGRVGIVAGFQGVSPITKEITTLGRGGSDLTAVALAAALKASRCELYKDVRGIYSVDPRVVPEARFLNEISTAQMLDLTWGGAGVVHARAIHVAEKFQIPLEVRSSFELERRGTTIMNGSWVKEEQVMERPYVSALAHKDHLCMVEIAASHGKLEQVASDVCQWLWHEGETPLVQQFQRSSSEQEKLLLTVPEKLQSKLQTLVTKERDVAVTRIMSQLTLVTVTGGGFMQSPEFLVKVRQLLGQSLQWFDVRPTALLLAVPTSAGQVTLRRLHEEFMPAETR